VVNVFFELDRLRSALLARGVDDRTINNIVAKARKEIDALFQYHGESAIDLAVQLGVEKRSPEFINELRLDALNFEVDTDSGRLDFSEPPKPMLPHLLKNAKPMKDGSGVYKVIPVGKPGDRPRVSTSIIDAQKKIMTDRAEQAKIRQRAIAPTGSKLEWKTATSKQDPQVQWVQPAKDKDFTSDVKAINIELTETLDKGIRDIINGYLEMF
jgi:hypothetical protein